MQQCEDIMQRKVSAASTVPIATSGKNDQNSYTDAETHCQLHRT